MSLSPTRDTQRVSKQYHSSLRASFSQLLSFYSIESLKSLQITPNLTLLKNDYKTTLASPVDDPWQIWNNNSNPYTKITHLFNLPVPYHFSKAHKSLTHRHHHSKQNIFPTFPVKIPQQIAKQNWICHTILAHLHPGSSLKTNIYLPLKTHQISVSR